MWRIGVVLAVLLSVVAGIASASVVSPGSAPQPAPDQREVTARSMLTGRPVADPHGGPPWAVRVFDGDSSWRCIVPGRVVGGSFGPADASGRVTDTGAVLRGSCADPAAEPAQVALARYAKAGEAGPQLVLFGIADASVVSVEVSMPGADGPVALDADRTFVVVSDGLSARGSSTVRVRLSDGTSRSYEL